LRLPSKSEVLFDPDRVLGGDLTARVTRLVSRLRMFNVQSLQALKQMWLEDEHFLKAELLVWFSKKGQTELSKNWITFTA